MTLICSCCDHAVMALCVLVTFLVWIVPHDAFLTPASALQSRRYRAQEKGTMALENIRNARASIPSSSIANITDGSKADPLTVLPQLHTFQKPRQKRRPQTTLTRARKPRYYWHSPINLRKELHNFWEELDVPIQKINGDRPPPIPSELLLNYFNRNDLRWGIAQMGGRDNVSHILGGAKIIPGRWKEAVEFKEVGYLLPQMDKYSKHRIHKSRAKKQKLTKANTFLQNRQRNTTQQLHQGNEEQGKENKGQATFTSPQNGNGSKNATTNSDRLSLASLTASIDSLSSHKKEFWSKEKAIKELYQYLERYRKYNRRPAVWMPQLAELSHEGYSKLFNACSRFEKLPCNSVFSSIQNEIQDESIHSVAGLVPFREWRFFESQFQLFVELEHYLSKHHNGSEEFFPEPSEVLMHGHTQLYELIRIHGGKTMLAQKLDMKFAWDVADENRPSSFSSKGARSISTISWGSFTLNFATRLLHFIRSLYLSLDPPLSSSFISMPSEKDLHSFGQDDLALQVIRYGGYENVARRLGLAYFDGKSQQMEEKRFRGAKLLWKGRNDIGVLSGTFTCFADENVNKRKRQGLAWDENLVINELHAYVNVNMTKRSLPSFVMPRLRHLDEDERGDLKRAICKFGGVRSIGDKAGLIPIEAWQKLD